ncbi:MAG: aminotransferase class [Gemmatimonadetes bacterium]|nr:aminotransferase class [Gemmatimonadota bacterium]
MSRQPIYLDHAASTPLRAEAGEAMLRVMSECFGNPSSVHRWGRAGRAALERARERFAAAIGAEPAEVVFTRGGTEADNLALLGAARLVPGCAVACSAVEHKAVLTTAHALAGEGHALHVLPVDGEGIVRLDAVSAALTERPAIISVMWANNEVGAVQPVEQVGALCRQAGVAFHSDAVQAFGKLEVRVDRTPVDLLSFSGHKFGGPRGVGALYVRHRTWLAPLIHGGGQERGLRAGTEDVAGAVAFALAAEMAEAERDWEAARLGGLRDRLEAGLRARVPELAVNAAGAPRLPHVCSVSVPGVEGGLLLAALDVEGIGVSAGSACSSGALGVSHVLTAMGVSPGSGPAVRFSLGRTTTAEEVERVLEAFPALVGQLREMAAA